jgi:hypothetical protein
MIESCIAETALEAADFSRALLRSLVEIGRYAN